MSGRQLLWKLLGVVSLTVGLVLSSMGGALAVELEGVAWWWRLQTGLVAPVERPDVPEGGLAISQAPDGPAAVGAIRFTLAEDERNPVLTLRPDSERDAGNAAIVACTTGARWYPVDAGAWAGRPPYDCDAAVAGVRQDDGTWRFDLSTLAADGVVDVAFTPPPDTTPFEVTFQPPTEDDIEVEREIDTTSDVDVPVVPPAGGAGNIDSSSPTAGTAPPPPPVPAGNLSVPAPEPPATPQQAAPEVAPPSTTSPTGGAEQPAQVVAQPAAVPAPDHSRTTAILLLLGTVVLAADLMRQPSPAPRKLGPLATGEPGDLRGVGRFAHARDGTPPPLV